MITGGCVVNAPPPLTVSSYRLRSSTSPPIRALRYDTAQPATLLPALVTIRISCPPSGGLLVAHSEYGFEAYPSVWTVTRVKATAPSAVVTPVTTLSSSRTNTSKIASGPHVCDHAGVSHGPYEVASTRMSPPRGVIAVMMSA